VITLATVDAFRRIALNRKHLDTLRTHRDTHAGATGILINLSGAFMALPASLLVWILLFAFFVILTMVHCSANCLITG
jgi:hypothetical protein